MNWEIIIGALLVLGIIFGKDRASRKIRNTIFLFLCMGIALVILEKLGILR